MPSLEPVTISAILLWAGLLLVVGLLFGAGDPSAMLRTAWRRHRRWRRRRASRLMRPRRVRQPTARVLSIERARRAQTERAL